MLQTSAVARLRRPRCSRSRPRGLNLSAAPSPPALLPSAPAHFPHFRRRPESLRHPSVPCTFALGSPPDASPRHCCLRVTSGRTPWTPAQPRSPNIRRCGLRSGLLGARHCCRAPELWFIPRLVVLPGPGQTRLRGLRRSSSSGGPVRRAIRCVNIMYGVKLQVKGYFVSSQGYPPRSPQIPRNFLFIHLSHTGCTQDICHPTALVDVVGIRGHNGVVVRRSVASIIIIS